MHSVCRFLLFNVHIEVCCLSSSSHGGLVEGAWPLPPLNSPANLNHLLCAIFKEVIC
jgi:hypothetical protein